MNLHRMLKMRADDGKPIRVGLIGAGKFGSMFLAQARFTPGLHVVGVADLDVERARKSMRRLGWPSTQIDAPDMARALADGKTHLTDDGMSLIHTSGLDVVIEATGDPGAGVRHALAGIEQGRHLVMVNVEADVLVGPLLAERASKAGLVYSLAYGDQPALICEMVDWARTAGFPVVCAGKGTRYLPAMHRSTPKTVWQHFGITDEEAVDAGMNPKMFNSFVDGTKSGIEMAAVANASGLKVPSQGLAFPACGVDDLAYVLRPSSMGGQLEHDGTVEVVTDLERDGRPVYRDLRWGVYITFKAPSDYARACFAQYGLNIDPSGDIASIYRPIHRPRARHQCRLGSPSRRTHRLSPELRGRCDRHRQEGHAGGRDAGRRGRSLCLGQAHAGRHVDRRRLSADRSCPSYRVDAACRSRRLFNHGRCRHGSRRPATRSSPNDDRG